LERRASRLDLDPDSAEAWVDGRLVGLREAATLAALAQADPDLVVEAALEDLAAKQAIFRDLDAVTRPNAILATNTSALSVTAIAGATGRPGRVVGLHFFNPAPVMPLVEVIVTPSTDPRVAKRAVGLMTSWGKVAVQCIDTPGFIVNRINRPFTLEALAILAAGRTTIAAIDESVRSAGYPMGPFELMDLIGLDVNLAAALGILERSRAAGDPLQERFRPSPIQERLVAAGRLGRKTGEGFYAYGPDGRALGPAAGFVRIDQPKTGPDGSEIAERITLSIVNEAYRALGDGVAAPADIDLALRLGAGHPAGPFEQVQSAGGPRVILDGLARHAGDGPRFLPAPALLDAAAES